ncbi:phospholipid phosphatase-related protein type 2 isoform X1 [Microcaecilia unicolor]|uniref:Phospholipid phosphatase-related protein type 5 n=1 Tax=Microcaecilia unicolor TaxID=1415580 RepID=A0A6P7X6B5_9AMPH|nr:phospholipid phosphatase-related protein type 2-like isoform X1 [Microcaecilia unicolor]XP_030051144.1 phospholipid phosphatase-related protein type 2 isoform X1 [Microcaecilia unicolor]
MARGRLNTKRSISIVPCFVFVEMVIMAGTVVLAYHFEYMDTFPTHIQGFFCYDSTYAKPYPGPEDTSRAPPVLVYSLVAAIPTVVILTGELTFFLWQSNWREEKTIVSGDCCYFNPLLRRIIRFLGVYSFGLFTTTIFANAGQVVTGSQTPHFLSVCRPNYTALGCQSPQQYVAEKQACTAGNPALVSAARKAFPSKDTALSAYAAVYTVMYITLVFKVKGSRLAKPSVCLLLLCPAFLVGVVRVAEFRNHWSDVLAGFLTGGAIATFLVVCILKNFHSHWALSGPLAPMGQLVSVPVVALPCIQSPLEKITGLPSQTSPDPRICLFPAAVTPDVLIPSRSISSDV